MLSKLMHLFMSLPRPDATWIKRSETLGFSFSSYGVVKMIKLFGKQRNWILREADD